MYNAILEYPSAWLFHSHGVFPARACPCARWCPWWPWGAIGPPVDGCGWCDWMYHAPAPTEVTKSSRSGYLSHSGRAAGLWACVWEEWDARRRGRRSGSVRERRLRARLGGVLKWVDGRRDGERGVLVVDLEKQYHVAERVLWA